MPGENNETGTPKDIGLLNIEKFEDGDAPNLVDTIGFKKEGAGRLQEKLLPNPQTPQPLTERIKKLNESSTITSLEASQTNLTPQLDTKALHDALTSADAQNNADKLKERERTPLTTRLNANAPKPEENAA